MYLQPFGIEIVPIEKNCDLWCPHCSLSTKKISTQSSSIHAQVQETFSLLEQKLYTQGRSYDLYFTSRTDLFPHIKYPQIINLTGFQLYNNISLGNIQETYANDIKNTLDHAHINPRILTFPFVPRSPIINQEEIQVIRQIIQHISKRFFSDNKTKSLTCGIASNFLTEKKLSDLFEQLDLSDKKNLNNILSDLLPNQVQDISDFSSKKNHTLYDVCYLSSLSTNVQWHAIKISNRAIGHKKINIWTTKSLQEKYDVDFADPMVDQSFIFGIWGVLVSPDGIMIWHSSITVNNPIFWVSHEDFLNTITSTENQNIDDICKNIINDNRAIYILLKREGILWLNKQEYMNIFTESRKFLKKMDSNTNLQ